MRRALLTLPLVLILGGCVSAPLDLSGARPVETASPSPSTEATAEPPLECIEVSPGALAGLQWGFDQKQPGFTVVKAAGYDVPQWESLTLVAAEFTGPGVPSEVALFSTLADVETAADAAYNSIDFIAAEFTAYMRPSDAPLDLPEFDLVESCLAEQ